MYSKLESNRYTKKGNQVASFGEKLTQARKKLGWFQDDLWQKVEDHGHHVGKYENGRAIPNADTIIRIAKILNVSIDYLLLDDFKENAILSAILQDWGLIRKFETVEKMDENNKHVITSLIDAYIKKATNRRRDKSIRGRYYAGTFHTLQR
jgi:transcriptional regulator with XRE-family HTH domain